MTIRANAGEAIAIPFTLLDNADPPAPITGAVDGDFTARLLMRGVDQGSPPVPGVVVSEVSGAPLVGRYLATFTPDEAGLWYLSLEYDPNGRQYAEDVEVGMGAIAHATLVDDGATMYARVWLTRDGRQVLDATSATVTLYDGAGTSVGTLTDPTDDGQGFFVGTFTPSPGITDNRTYGVKASVTDPAGTVVTTYGAIAVSTA